MRVLTYVNGELIVIDGDSFYKEQVTKPSFITGTNFYYEPTLQQMDGVQLTQTLKDKADAYITSFVFPIIVTSMVKYYVDIEGNYIGNKGIIEVPSAPTVDTEKWNGTAWVDSVLIDKTTKLYKGVGDTRTAVNAEYAPNTLINPTFDINRYFWDNTTSTWGITLADAIISRKRRLKSNQSQEITQILGTIADKEVASFTTQEKEARAWDVDNTIPTPFVDNLLTARAISGETKQILVDKIIAKADAYASFYATQLGKFQNLVKQVDNATTVDEVKAIVW